MEVVVSLTHCTRLSFLWEKSLKKLILLQLKFNIPSQGSPQHICEKNRLSQKIWSVASGDEIGHWSVLVVMILVFLTVSSCLSDQVNIVLVASLRT